MAAEVGCHLFDSAEVTGASVIDGIHLDLDRHPALGEAAGISSESALKGRPGRTNLK